MLLHSITLHHNTYHIPFYSQSVLDSFQVELFTQSAFVMKSQIIGIQNGLSKSVFDFFGQVESQLPSGFPFYRNAEPKANEAQAGNLEVLGPSISELEFDLMSLYFEFGRLR